MMGTDHRRDTDQFPADTEAERRTLRVLVLPRVGTRPLFYYEPVLGSEPDEAEGADAPEDGESGGGIRGGIKRLVHGVRRAEEKAPSWVRGPIRWVRSKLPADERLMQSLRKADAVELAHPPSLPADDVLGAWTSYLNSRFHRHAWGVAIYLILLVPTAILFVVPGPNIIGIWVAFRLIAHGLALYGIVRARRGRVAIRCEASEALEGPVIFDRKVADRVQRHFGLQGLSGRLKRERVMARLRHRRVRGAPVADGEARR